MGSWNVNSGGTTYHFIDFWSAAGTSVTITGASSDVLIGNSTAIQVGSDGLPLGCTIIKAVAMLKFRKITEDSAADNYLNTAGATVIDTTTSTTLIEFSTGIWKVDASGESGGDVVVGTNNFASIVSNATNTTLIFRLENVQALAANLYLHDIQGGVRVYYSV